ncbi:T6SS phospholipase effector Tle1-like catalytic domain-containing protein, partial [Iodobacter arcticus]
ELKAQKLKDIKKDEDKDWPKAVPQGERCFYRKTYIPGVGTPFVELGDITPSAKKSSMLSAAYAKVAEYSVDRVSNKGGEVAALFGEVRINWALLQLTNHLHEAILGSPHPSSALKADGKLAQKMISSASAAMSDVVRLTNPMARILFDQRIDRNKTLRERSEQLRPLIAPFIQGRVQGKPKIKRVRIAVFGFSRGAAAARVFVTWLKQAYGSEIAGLELKVDFLGIFDTVASVGLAQSAPTQDGHSGWASAENLKVADDVRCVHLVAAHEVRGSFPLDAIGSGALHKEVMYPGVHSDVGGGYEPLEQGRSIGESATAQRLKATQKELYVEDENSPYAGVIPAEDKAKCLAEFAVTGDSKKLSQIPLAQMYREALIAGVPLIPSSELRAIRMRNFAIHPETIKIFNQYIESTKAAKIKPTGGMWLTETQPSESLQVLSRRHYGQFLAWRKQRLGRIHLLPELQNSFYSSKARDINDFQREDVNLAKELELLRSRATMIQGEKQAQWDSSIQYIWDQEVLIPALVPLFETLMHDSKAWFGLEPYRMWGYLRWRKIYLADGKAASQTAEKIDDSEHVQRLEKNKQVQLDNERITHEARMRSLEGQRVGAAKQQQLGKDMSEFSRINQQQRQEELLRHQQALKQIQGHK